MHYYQFNIGDYASHTRHLSPLEDIAYRRLLDISYTTELPLSKDIRVLSRLINMREYQQEIEDVLKEFYIEVDDGWVNNRVIKEIERTGKKSESAKNSAAIRWDRERKAKALQLQYENDANALKEDANASKNDATHNPIPITQDTQPITQIKDMSSPTSKTKVLVPYEKIVSLYNEILTELPSVVAITEKRKSQIKKLWTGKPGINDLQSWVEYFNEVKTIKFFHGENDRGWKSDFDFITRYDKFIAIVEGGKYK